MKCMQKVSSAALGQTRSTAYTHLCRSTSQSVLYTSNGLELVTALGKRGYNASPQDYGQEADVHSIKSGLQKVNISGCAPMNAEKYAIACPTIGEERRGKLIGRKRRDIQRHRYTRRSQPQH